MKQKEEKSFTVMLDSELKRKALAKAILEETTLKQVITDALIQFINK